MNVSHASVATPGQPNEDFVVSGSDWAVILDGATPPSGVDSGCIHDVPWLVRNLASSIVDRLLSTADSLPDAVAAAIDITRRRHSGTCDVTNPSSPSSTVAILRSLPEKSEFEYLVLADSPIVFEVDGKPPIAIVDDRTDHLPSYTPEAVRSCRNQPGGFWVASTVSEAAYESVNGFLPADGFTRAALLTDGSARYVQRFALSDWAGLLDILDKEGPFGLIRRVRAAEAAETDQDRQREKRRGKRYDDATVAFLRP